MEARLKFCANARRMDGRGAEYAGGLPHIDPQERYLVRELHERLNAVWLYGECLGGTEPNPEWQRIWRDFRDRELDDLKQLKLKIFDSIDQGMFLEGR